MKSLSSLSRSSILGLLFIAMACGGGSSSKKKVKLDVDADEEETAKGLFEEYQKAKEDDDVGTHMAPLKKYKGKTFILTGTIKGKSKYKNPQTGESGESIGLEVGSDDWKDDVTVNLKNDKRQDDLEEGMKVKVAGTYVTNYMGPTIHDAQVKILE